MHKDRLYDNSSIFFYSCTKYIFLLNKNRKVKISLICILTVLFETGAQHLIVSKEKKLYDVFPSVFLFCVCGESHPGGKAESCRGEEGSRPTYISTPTELNCRYITQSLNIVLQKIAKEGLKMNKKGFLQSF